MAPGILPLAFGTQAMATTKAEELKRRVRDHWDAQACGTQNTAQPKFSREYFDEIEALRYQLEPFIFSFAQFTRHRGQKVLEVGVGAGTDFVQWVRANAEAYGVDLTPEAIEHVRNRLAVYGLQARDFRVADCESLPFEDETFDLVYSWGVIHHTPDTAQALAEIVRVLRPGGMAKLMVYHRHSLVGLYQWVKWALLRGRPWRSISWCFHNCVESPGTKAFTRSEVLRMLQPQPVENLQIRTILTRQDRLGGHNPLARGVARLMTTIAGPDRAGFYMTIQFRKQKKQKIQAHEG